MHIYMHFCLNGKAKNKKKFRGGFAECNDHCTRQRKLKKNKKHPLPSAGAVALGKEV